MRLTAALWVVCVFSALLGWRCSSIRSLCVRACVYVCKLCALAAVAVIARRHLNRSIQTRSIGTWSMWGPKHISRYSESPTFIQCIHALGALGEMARTFHSRRSYTWHKVCVVCVHKSFASFVKYRPDGAQRKSERDCHRIMLNVYIFRMLDMKMTAWLGFLRTEKKSSREINDTTSQPKEKRKRKIRKEKRKKGNGLSLDPENTCEEPTENGSNSIGPCATLAALDQYVCVNFEFGKVNANENEIGDGDS